MALALSASACSGGGDTKTGTSQTLGEDAATDGATADGAAPADTAAVDTTIPQSDTGSGQNDTAQPADVPVVADNGGCPTPDAEMDSGTTPDAGPPKPGQPGWVPNWKDANGCYSYEHWDPVAKACEPDNAQIQLDEVSCWNHGQANDLGVGKLCKPGEYDCGDNSKATCCHVDDRGYGAICSMYCANAKTSDPACGPNAWCGPMHVCMADVCVGGFTDSQKTKSRNVTTLGLPCPVTSTYTFPGGVGTPCTTTGAECKGLAANECLGITYSGVDTPLAAGVSSFCSHACQVDADCGAGSSCIYFNGKPYFCAPTDCKWQFATFTFKHGAAPVGNPVCNQPPKP